MAWVTVAVLCAAGGWWAGRVSLEPPAPPATPVPDVSYEVVEGTVSRVQSFTAEASWDRRPLGTNTAAGTVTTIDVANGEEVTAGQQVYSVGLKPVVALPGAVPAFRDLAEGVRGADVRQLEDFLVAEGLLSGADDRYGSSTVEAVRTWQESWGQPRTGTVLATEVLFVPTLPARVVLDDVLRVGAVLSPGQPVLFAVAEAPEIAVILSTEQQDFVPLATDVRVEGPDGVWTGEVARAVATPDGQMRLELQAMGGGPICGDQCATIPVEGSARYRTDLVVVPETTGPVVPVAAILTGPDGSTSVLVEGETLPITILAAAEGQAVVEGVAVGETIRFPTAQDTGS